LGLASSEKQIPQFVENIVNSKHRMETMEWLGMLAKQALPAELHAHGEGQSDSKAFPLIPESIPSHFGQNCSKTPGYGD
jgi:hypothetical protein